MSFKSNIPTMSYIIPVTIVEDVCSVCTVYVKCVLCQYKEDDGGHCQESQQYDKHNTYASPQRIVL